MKRTFHLPIVTFILITLLVSVGCGTKEVVNSQPVVENVDGLSLPETDRSQSAETELRDNPRKSPEAELRDNPRKSPESEHKDKTRRSPEAEHKDKIRRSPESEHKDKVRRSPEAELGDNPRKSLEAEHKDKIRRSPEAELRDNPRKSPEAEHKDKIRRSPEAELRDNPRISYDVELKESEQTLSANQNDVSPSPELVQKIAEAEKEIEKLKQELQQEVEQLTVQIPRESVLHLIPDSTIGVIYCPSLLELNDRINSVYAELAPQAGPSPELLAQFLADTFDAGFESLVELEDIGLDLNNDFAVFISSVEPFTLSAIIHISDRDAIEQIILDEAEDSEPIQYKDVTYWNTPDGEGSFVILDDTLVFSQQQEVCENVIDIDNEQQGSIVQSLHYKSFISTVMEDAEQVAAYFNLQSIISSFAEQIDEELQSSLDSMQSDPDVIAALPFIEGFYDKITILLKEIISYSVSLKIDGTDVVLSQFIQFSNDGKIQTELKRISSDELNLIHDLPNGAFLCGGVNGNPEILFDLSKSLLEVITLSSPDESEDGIDDIKKQFETIVQDFTDLEDTFSNEIGFSVSFSESLIPDIVLVFDLKDEQKLKQYMDQKFLMQVNNIIQLLHDSADDPLPLSMFEESHFGNSIMHNEAEIKSIVFPNFGNAFIDVDPDVALMMPQEWQWSYAFSKNQFYFAFGGPQHIQAALDSNAKIGESLAENVSFQELIDKLGADSNILYGISLLTAAKSIMALVSNTDPNAAAALQMFTGVLEGIPENFSIGYALKVRDDGIGTKNLIALGDFKQLILTIATLSGMDMLQ